MPRKRKTLPKDFQDLLESAPLEELIAVFDRCELDARGGYRKATSLGFAKAPDGLIRWLVGQGLDPDSRDAYGETALASRAVVWQEPARQIPLFLSLGADIEGLSGGSTPLQLAVQRGADYAASLLIEHGAAVSGVGWDPTTMLEHALSRVENSGITQAAKISKLMIRHGARATDPMRASVTKIGEGFERYRSVFSADRIEETENSLNELYRMFEVGSAPRRVLHDGASPIVMPEGNVGFQHETLWELLVPGSGPAPTQQGEVIRITGKVSDEMFRNGGGNWDGQFRALVDAAAQLMRGGNSLPSASLADLDTAVIDVRSGRGSEDSLRTFTRLSVEWVALNPTPIPLGAVSYAR